MAQFTPEIHDLESLPIPEFHMTPQEFSQYLPSNENSWESFRSMMDATPREDFSDAPHDNTENHPGISQYLEGVSFGGSSQPSFSDFFQQPDARYGDRGRADASGPSSDAGGAESDRPQEPRHPLTKIRTGRGNRDRWPRIWEFLVRLLTCSHTNPSLVCWEDESRYIFRIKSPSSVAHMWGDRSEKSITYSHFARGLRYHYGKGGLREVREHKLVYGLGPKAIEYLEKIQTPQH